MKKILLVFITLLVSFTLFAGTISPEFRFGVSTVARGVEEKIKFSTAAFSVEAGAAYKFTDGTNGIYADVFGEYIDTAVTTAGARIGYAIYLPMREGKDDMSFRIGAYCDYQIDIDRINAGANAQIIFSTLIGGPMSVDLGFIMDKKLVSFMPGEHSSDWLMGDFRAGALCGISF